MSEMTLAPRRRPLWRLFIVPVLVLIAAVAWSGFWFYAASEVDAKADAWRAQEAKSGRVYECARRTVAGFPFRLEVRCDGASVSLISQTAGQAAAQAPITAALGEILIVAQVYDPKLLIAEFTAPATISDRGGQPSMAVTWSKARSSVVGLPAIPQRASIVFDDPEINRFNGSVQAPLAHAKHIELHGRLVEGAPADHPVVETVLKIEGGSLQEVHPLLAQPFDADVRTMLSGLTDFFAKTLATAVPRDPGRRRPCRDRAVPRRAGRFDRGCRRYARPHPRGTSRRRIADDGCRHREGHSGAGPREDAG